MTPSRLLAVEVERFKSYCGRARLLALNQQLAEEQRKVVASEKKPKDAPKPSPTKRSPTIPGPSLFGDMKPA